MRVPKMAKSGFILLVGFGTLSGIAHVHAFYDKQLFPKCESGIKTISDHFRNNHVRNHSEITMMLRPYCVSQAIFLVPISMFFKYAMHALLMMSVLFVLRSSATLSMRSTSSSSSLHSTRFFALPHPDISTRATNVGTKANSTSAMNEDRFRG
jgi:hypothetical protein